MGNIDGDVKIRVSLESRDVNRGADRIKRKMQSIAKDVSKTFSKSARQDDVKQTIAGYEEQIQAAERSIRAEQERIALLKQYRKEIEYKPETREKVDRLGIENLDTEIDAAHNKIAAFRKEIQRLKGDIKNSGEELKEIGNKSNPFIEAIDRMNTKITTLARRIFIFNLLRRAFTAMSRGLMNLLAQDSAVSKSMAQLRGSLYAAFMPIYNYALPAIRTLISFLAQLASAVANIIGGIFGVSSAALANASALNQQAGATGAAGSAAKKAAKQIAAFDEINQMSDESGGGGGGSGGGGSNWDFSGLDQVSKKMQVIAKLVLSIGAGIAAWKLAKALGALKDASMLRNLSFIAGAALTIWSIFDLLLPSIRSIIDEGPNLKNVLGTMSGIFTTLSGIAFMSGSIGGGFLWLALGAGALIAKNWDKVSEALKVWDEKISAMVEGVPILEKAYEGVRTVAIAIKNAFVEIASLITKWSTEGFSIDILGEIGNMSFTSKAISGLVTWNLIKTIAKLIGIKGKVSLGTTAGIVFSLFAIIDIVTDAIDIDEGTAEEQTEKTKNLILKLLFGAAGAAVTAIFGGGAKAMLLTVPLAMELSLAAAEWDSVSEKLGSWANVLEPIIGGFNELADVITKVVTEGMSMEVLGNISDMSFTSTAIASVITAGLLTKIGSMIGLKGIIRPGTTTSIALILSAAIELGLDIVNITEGTVEDKSSAIGNLIAKVLFGAGAAAVAVLAGAGSLAFTFVMPIAIIAMTEIFGSAESETIYDDQIADVVRASQSVEDLKTALQGITGMKFSDEAFESLIAADVPENLRHTAQGLDEMKTQAEAFIGLFMQNSSTEGFDKWLASIGLVGLEATELEESLAASEQILQGIGDTSGKTINFDMTTISAIEAANSMLELKSIIESFTGIKLSDDQFFKLLERYGGDAIYAASALDYAKDGTHEFLQEFSGKENIQGLVAWLESLGLLSDEVVLTQEALDDFGAKYDAMQQQTEGTIAATENLEAELEDFGLKYQTLQAQTEAAATATENLNTAMESTPEMTLDSTGMGDLTSATETLQVDLENVETGLGNVETAATDAGTTISEDMGTAFDDVQTGATETGNVMTRVFNVAAFRMKTALQTSMNGIFKSFQSGGSVFQGIETGIEKIFKSIVNGLIDGINSVLNTSFGKINTALDKIRNTQVDGTKPFISLPRVSISKIPRLAEGAVIPANREFLAILGDQKNGTNIEAPLDTIVEAVMIAMARAGMDGGNIAAAVRAALSGMSVKVGKKEIGHVVADAINANRRDEGKLALNL